jgi:hypothetical protein
MIQMNFSRGIPLRILVGKLPAFKAGIALGLFSSGASMMNIGLKSVAESFVVARNQSD